MGEITHSTINIVQARLRGCEYGIDKNPYKNLIVNLMTRIYIYINILVYIYIHEYIDINCKIALIEFFFFLL